MSSFRYEAFHSADKRRVSGTLEAVDMHEARRMLMQQELVPLKLHIELEPARKTEAQDLATGGVFGFLGKWAGQTRREQLMAFTRSLAAMLGAGLSFTAALQNQEQFARSRHLKKVARTIRQDILAGASLVQAMARYPDYFDPVYLGILEAGERSGQLETALLRLAELLRRRDRVAKKTRQLMMYPLFCGFCWMVFGYAFTTVYLPVVVEGMQKVHLKPTAYVQALMAVRYVWPLGVLALMWLLGRLGERFAASRWGSRALAETSWWLPKLSTLVELSACESFVSTLRVTLSSGLSMDEAVGLAVQSIGHGPLREAYSEALAPVREGHPLMTALVHIPYIPAEVLQMVAAGEESGRLEQILEAAEVYLEDEIIGLLAVLFKVAQFLLILFIWVCVGIFLAFFYATVFGGLFGSIAAQIAEQITQHTPPPPAAPPLAPPPVAPGP